MYETLPEIVDSEISDNCYLELGTRIISSRLLSNVRCYKFSHVKNSTIGEHCIIGDLSKIDNCVLNMYNKIEKYNQLYHVAIGDYTYTGPYTVAMHSKIGKFSSISWGVTLGGAEHDYERLTTHAFLYNSYFELKSGNDDSYNRFEKPCSIGNDVWIGANVTILRGVRIGDGAVIAANSLVNKDVPPYSIVGGVPAKVIKYRFEESLIEKLLDVCWWDFPPDVIRSNFLIFSDKLCEKSVNTLIKIRQNL